MRIVALGAVLALCAGCVSPGSAVDVEGGLLTGHAAFRVDTASPAVPEWRAWGACLAAQRATRDGDECLCATAYPRLGNLPAYDRCYAAPAGDPAGAERRGAERDVLEGADLEPLVEALKRMLRADEGFEPGAPGHVGYGHLLPLSVADAEALLEVAAGRAVADAAATAECWADLDRQRRLVLGNMAYQHGAGGLGGYEDMLGALCAGDHAAAAAEMLDSVWATSQAPARAKRLARLMEEDG